MSTVSKSVLVLGFSASGKTHFGAQLLDRLRSGSGRVKLGSFPSDLTGLEEALRCLQGGLAAEHTPHDTYAQVPLSLSPSDSAPISLVWPDYGGEQLRQIFEQRRVPPAWGTRLAAADEWMLFIRPSTMNTPTSGAKKLEARLERGAPREGASSAPWDDNARFVELLQLLLYSGGRSLLTPLKRPRLAVLLSCWDEMPQAQQTRAPFDLLNDRLPMFTEFLSSNWDPESRSVWGLSSLGKTLSKERPDADYIDKGPGSHGYVVRPDSDRSVDLTEPLEWLLGGR